jgi:hypothetical protein
MWSWLQQKWLFLLVMVGSSAALAFLGALLIVISKNPGGTPSNPLVVYGP